ncbi:MAG: N-acetyltransferase [Blautia hansenii]
MQAAAEEISRQGKKAVLTCSYAKGWFARHKEFQHIIQE